MGVPGVGMSDEPSMSLGIHSFGLAGILGLVDCIEEMLVYVDKKSFYPFFGRFSLGFYAKYVIFTSRLRTFPTIFSTILSTPKR